MSADPVALELRHAVPGRVRLRPAKAMDADALKSLGDRLASVPGLRRVLMRPNKTSPILDFEGVQEPILAAITAQGIARIRPPAPPPPIGQVAQLGLLRADMALKSSTQDTLNLNSTLALLLLAGAAVQFSRGQIAGPATSLLLAALSMLDRSRAK